MRKRKFFAALIGAAAIAGSLTACSGGSGSSSGPVTISFWNGFTASDRTYVEQIVKNFNASQTKVKVDMTIEPWDTLYEKLLPAYAAGSGPTIVGMDVTQFPGYASKGVLKDMSDFYSGWSGSSDLKTANVNATKYNGVQYGAPMTGSTSMMYYNKKLLAAAGIATPPATQTELAADALKITKYDAAKPTNSIYGLDLPDNNAVETWIAFMQGNGGGVISSDGKTAILDSAASISTVDYWAGLEIKNHISPVGLSGVQGDALFSAGKAAFYINGPWASAGFTQAKVDFGVANVPAGTVGNAASLNSDNFGIDAKATSAEAKAAETFIQYWDSPKSQLIYSLGSGVPPITNAVTTAQLAKNPTAVAFADAKGATPSYPAQPNFAQMDANIVLPTIQKIENGKGTAASLFPAASKQIAALIK